MKTKICSKCQYPNPANLDTCFKCGAPLLGKSNTSFVKNINNNDNNNINNNINGNNLKKNDSGQGSNAILPDELKGLNWGAFFCPFFWALDNKTRWDVVLLGCIPYVGIISNLIYLFKGNEWAWKSRRFYSYDNFKENQKKWIFKALTIDIVAFIIIFIIRLVQILNK